MRPIRLLSVLLVFVLAGCASHGTRDHGYYYRDGAGGDYYHGYASAPRWSVGAGYGAGWYDPYDALFWGVRYSYWDPFWFPYFHYGVTWYPRWYYGGYWGWRGWHPYSPWYGSWWDHYYAWDRTPRRPGYRGGGHATLDPQRYGSARNAAERMAATRRGLDGLGRFDSGIATGRPASVRWQPEGRAPAMPDALPRDRFQDRAPHRRGDGGLAPVPMAPPVQRGRGEFTVPPAGRSGREGGPAPARRGDLPAGPAFAPAPARSPDWSDRGARPDRGGPSLGRPAAPERGSLQRDLPRRGRD